MQKIYGNVQGIKASQIKHLQQLYISNWTLRFRDFKNAIAAIN
ncbi:MAG: hypothetical protein RMZ41_030070 [Nostoc sp. DedVER02]